MSSSAIIPLSQQPQRAEEIAHFLFQEWHQLDNWADPLEVAERLHQRNLPGSVGFTLLALSDSGELSGTASVIEYELSDNPARRYWLGEVFTLAEWRGQGIGSRLVNACIAHARQQGVAELWLYTPDRQALYRRLGWREVEQREVNGEWVSVMVRAL